MSCVVSGVGRLVKDPELKKVNNTHVLDFALAVDEFVKTANGREKRVSFFNFVAWDKGAEVLAQYAKKGSRIYFQATPRQEKWKDKDGNQRDKVVFRLDTFRFMDGAKTSEENTTGDSNDSNDGSDAPW